MSTYYEDQIKKVESKNENYTLYSIKISNSTDGKSTNFMNLNIESISIIQQFLESVKQNIVTLNSKEV